MTRYAPNRSGTVVGTMWAEDQNVFNRRRKQEALVATADRCRDVFGPLSDDIGELIALAAIPRNDTAAPPARSGLFDRIDDEFAELSLPERVAHPYQATDADAEAESLAELFDRHPPRTREEHEGMRLAFETAALTDLFARR